MRAAGTALSRALALSAALPLCACGWLAAEVDLGDAGEVRHPAPPDGGTIGDGGGHDAAPPVDGGTADAGEPDGGAAVDAGGDGGLAPDPPLVDAGDEDDGGDDPGADDAGDLDAGHDAGEPPLLDAGVDAGPDAGSPFSARVLASGSGLAAETNIPLDPAALAEVDTLLLFLAREEVAVVDVPGNWSGSDFQSRGSGDERVVGATRYFQDEPTSLGTSFSIEVESGERFSYALVGVAGADRPSDSAASEDDSENAAECNGGPASHHEVELSYAFYGVNAVAHRRAPATVPSPGRLLVDVEPEAGPALIVQELEGPAETELNLRVCLGGAGPFVSLAHGFRLP